MEIELTKKQKQLLAVAMNKGFLTLKDCFMKYSSINNIKNALKRLEIVGLIKKGEFGDKWIYNGDQRQLTIELLKN